MNSTLLIATRFVANRCNSGLFRLIAPRDSRLKTHSSRRPTADSRLIDAVTGEERLHWRGDNTISGECDWQSLFNLETSVGSRIVAHALDSPSYMKKILFTNKVNTNFFITLFKSISCTLISRSTDVSRFKRLVLLSCADRMSIVQRTELPQFGTECIECTACIEQGFIEMKLTDE